MERTKNIQKGDSLGRQADLLQVYKTVTFEVLRESEMAKRLQRR